MMDFLVAHPALMIAALPFIFAPVALVLGPRDPRLAELVIGG